MPILVNVGLETVTDVAAVGPSVAQTVGQLNSILRGEIAAAETYRMAIDKISETDQKADVGLLREIQEEHGRAAQAVRDRIRELAGEPADASGAWGIWAKTVQGIAGLLGNHSCLKALKEGEEHGLKDYEAALDQLDATSRQLIQNQFLPAQQRHITLLSQLTDLPAHA